MSSDGYRFLGTYGESVADRTFPSDKVGTVKAGTPLGWTARLETRVVDQPGNRG
ncbi:hypothetical protein [Nonomuraea sp. NPDC049480]|uniref:hypothetical protein n=1 Tax=Nonomuraea sp. NPDC049480 TaxID=3364353 RepID=UPI0037A451F0